MHPPKPIKPIILMKTHSRLLILVICFLNAATVQGEIKREEIIDLPCSRLVYDFLSALHERYSMVRSKALFSFLVNSDEVRAIQADKHAWIETVLVEEILDIKEDIRNEIVTAVVRTDENRIEVWIFRMELKAGKALIVPSPPVSSLSHLKPWVIRIKDIAKHLKDDTSIVPKR